MLGLVGVMFIETSVAAVTEKFVVPLTRPEVTVITTVPVLTADPNPSVPPALLIVATALFDDDQVAVAVRSCVELSL